MLDIFVFFFQAEDGIRDDLVTGVQTCALPISLARQCMVNQSRKVFLHSSICSHFFPSDDCLLISGKIRFFNL